MKKLLKYGLFAGVTYVVGKVALGQLEVPAPEQ